VIVNVAGSTVCSPAQWSAVVRILDGLDPQPDGIAVGDAAGVEDAAAFWCRENLGPPLPATADADQLLAIYCRKPDPDTAAAVKLARRCRLFVREFDLSRT
jgi:hypothetical protein